MHHLSHLSGWLALILGILACLTYVARKSRIQHLKGLRGIHHKILGKLAIFLGILHGVWSAGFSLSGILGVCAMLGLWVSYGLRQKIGKRWLTVHRLLSLLLIFVVGIHLFYYVH